jgi:hypothetical protein
MTTADPIAAHVAALERVLRGPRRTRRCMVAEVRTGLRDAADAYRAGGLAPDAAARLAVRDFGAVNEVARSFQDELTARQGRLTALLFVVVFPGMLLGWDLLWSSGAVRTQPRPAPEVVTTLAAVQDVTTVLVGLAALAMLAVTFSRTVSVRHLTSVIAVTGAVGAVACGGISVAMNLAGGQTSVELLTGNPAAVAACTVSAVMLVLLVWQSVRTLRIARTH